MEGDPRREEWRRVVTVDGQERGLIIVGLGHCPRCSARSGKRPASSLMMRRVENERHSGA